MRWILSIVLLGLFALFAACSSEPAAAPAAAPAAVQDDGTQVVTVHKTPT